MTIEGAIDEHRCRAVHDGRRCQLWDDHARTSDAQHAAWWQIEDDQAPGSAPRRLRPARLLLWTDDGTASEGAPDGVRRRWAAMGIA